MRNPPLICTYTCSMDMSLCCLLFFSCAKGECILLFQDKELIIEEPRIRKKTTRYGNDNGVMDISDLGSSSDTDTDSKATTGRGRRGRRRHDEDTDFESERHVAKSRGPGYGRSELFKVEKGLLVYG